MNKIFDYLFLNTILRAIPADNIVERQRFILFRWFSLLAVWTCVGLTTEIYATIVIPFAFTVPLLIALFAFNYLLLAWHGNRRASYFILVSLILFEIHFTSYFTGGLRNNAMFFSTATLLAAFMLLGTRAGFFFSLLVIANQFYFFFISENTGWVTDVMVNHSSTARNLDYLLTGSISLIVIATQLIGLEGSKTYVLQKLNHSKTELKKKNAELEELIVERKKSLELLAENLHRLENANLELKQKNEDLDRFAYLVSHDLKAPLRAIGSMTKFIEEDAAEKLPPETHHFLDVIRGRIQRMEKLISDILSYSQSTRTKKSLSEFTLNEAVHEAIDLIMLPADCKIIVQGGETKITTDAIRLRQVILNLLVNAIKHHHTKTGIEIKISASNEVTQWHIAVSDNGPGIDSKYHDKIFQIFQTLNAKDNPESSGIGLAIVKKIVEDLNGKIWIESEQGRGTTFHFTLPIKNTKTGTELNVVPFAGNHSAV